MSTQLSKPDTKLSAASREAAYFSEQQFRLLSDAIMKGASPAEIQFFGEVCRRTGLDPFRKQIHAVSRWDGKEKRMVWAYQTGIDGFLAIAHRTGKCAGIEDAVFEPKDESAEFPTKATVTVWKIVGGEKVAFTASARWREYCQFTREGKVTSMWMKLPYSMLGKCALALALRKAFPEDLSGLHAEEEMHQASNPEPAPRSAYRLPELEDVEAPPVEAEVVEEKKPEAKPAPAPSRMPELAVPDALQPWVGGKWKHKQLADGRKLGNLKSASFLKQREHLPEGLREPLLASYIDQILAILDAAKITEKDFAEQMAERPDIDVGFAADLWADPAIYHAILGLAKETTAA